LRLYTAFGANMEKLLPALYGACILSLKLILIIVTLVTVFEVFRYLPLFRRVGKSLEPFMEQLGLSRRSAVPLFTGFFLGISYGAGIILRAMQMKRFSRRELFLLGLFLATCHGVVEDTLIFVAIGANGSVILGIRFVLALVLTGLLARCWRLKKSTASEDELNTDE